MIDRPATEPTLDEQPDPGRLPDASRLPDVDRMPGAPHDAPPYESGRGASLVGRSFAGVPITLAVIVVALAMIGSLAYIGYVVLAIDEEQIPLLAAGFAVLGASFAAVAIGSLVGMWRAASRAAGGRALVLAIAGGVAGLAAIGCFTVTALSAMLWNT